MTHWIYPANIKTYDVIAAFNKSIAYWPINSNVSVGDIIYIYLSAPYKQIAFTCKVGDIENDEISVLQKIKHLFKDENHTKKQHKQFMKLNVISATKLKKDSSLSFQVLQENGLNGSIRGAYKLENNPILFKYIKGVSNGLQ